MSLVLVLPDLSVRIKGGVSSWVITLWPAAVTGLGVYLGTEESSRLTLRLPRLAPVALPAFMNSWDQAQVILTSPWPSQGFLLGPRVQCSFWVVTMMVVLA